MPRIVVAGSLNMDLVMQSPRVPVLGETIPAGPFITSHGGKGAHQAVAWSRYLSHAQLDDFRAEPS